MSLTSFAITNIRSLSIKGRHHLLQIGLKPCLKYSPSSSDTSIRLKSNGPRNKHGVEMICKNISIKYHSQSSKNNNSVKAVTGGDGKNDGQSESSVGQKSGRLLVMLAWIRAQEKYLEKYRQIYLKHGFDVLTVYTNPIDFMLPTIGTQRNAQNLVDYLINQGSSYADVVVHGFSVGAYEFGEVLLILNRALEKSKPNSAYHRLIETMRGLIFDSAVDVSGAPIGVSRSVGGETFLADLVQVILKLYMRMFYSIATKHYEASSKAFHNNFLRCPALFLFSHRDVISDTKVNTSMAEKWTSNGINVTIKDFNGSRHVTHLRKYPDEYERQIEDFISKLHFASK